jgi:apolipoprotein N-acyltransferase
LQKIADSHLITKSNAMKQTGFKKVGWLVTALVLIALPLGVFWYLLSINIDCDQFACIGYFILFMPMFFLGVSILLIVLIVNIVMTINNRFKRNENEEYD